MYKWTLVYFIAHFSSIWKWNDALSSLVCLFVLSSWDNERKIRIACVLGTFVEEALVALFQGKRKEGLDERDVQCHRQPKFSFCWIVCSFFFSMIALFVLICTCYLKDKIIIWLYNPPQLLKYWFCLCKFSSRYSTVKGKGKINRANHVQIIYKVKEHFIIGFVLMLICPNMTEKPDKRPAV